MMLKKRLEIVKLFFKRSTRLIINMFVMYVKHIHFSIHLFYKALAAVVVKTQIIVFWG